MKTMLCEQREQFDGCKIYLISIVNKKILPWIIPWLKKVCIFRRRLGLRPRMDAFRDSWSTHDWPVRDERWVPVSSSLFCRCSCPDFHLSWHGQRCVVVTARNGSGFERFRFLHGLFLDQCRFRERIPISWIDFLVSMICQWKDDFVFGNGGRYGSGGKSLISESNFGHQWNHISLGGCTVAVCYLKTK